MNKINIDGIQFLKRVSEMITDLAVVLNDDDDIPVGMTSMIILLILASKKTGATKDDLLNSFSMAWDQEENWND